MKYPFVSVCFCLFTMYSCGYSQRLVKARLVESLLPTVGPNGEILSHQIEYDINCEFSSGIDPQRGKQADLWRVTNDGKLIPIKQIVIKPTKKEDVKLVIDYQGYENMTIDFEGTGALRVDIDSVTLGKVQWNFGKGKSIDINVDRIAQQKSLLAFDYTLGSKIMQYNLPMSSKNSGFRSLYFGLSSHGTFGSDDNVRNGTQSSIELASDQFYFVGDLIYDSNISCSYQVETKMDAGQNRVLRILNKAFTLGATAEIPYSNYPMFKWHQVSRYARVALPLTLSVNYDSRGQDGEGMGTSSRLDFKAVYELAFSPYLLLQGEWDYSAIQNPPTGMERSASYYSIAFAQDLDATKTVLGILKFILGSGEDVKGKNFVFYKISSGRKAPSFQNINEQSFGFGTSF